MKKALQQRGLDNLDVTILEELQRNGRTSVADLARKIHLSQPAVHNRIKRLEREGIIREYVALLDRERVGYGLMCFVQVTLNPHTQAIIDVVRQAVYEMVSVLECYAITGRSDLMLKIMVEDQHDLHNFVTRLTTLEGIERVETSIVLQPIKETTALSLD